MIKKIAIAAVVFSLILVIVACSGPAGIVQTPTQKTPQTETPSTTVVVPSTPTPLANPKPSGLIKAKWIDPQVDGSTVSIPLSEVKNNWNTHFKIVAQSGTMNFMAYVLDGEIYVRANVCPPCKSIGFSLDNDILVCDRCATTFKAKTGAGIQGACVNYPKAAVLYKTVNDNIVINETDLAAAYQDTIKPG